MDNSTADDALRAVALAKAKLTAAQDAAQRAADELDAARKAANELTAAQRAVESSIARLDAARKAANGLTAAQRAVASSTARLAADDLAFLVELSAYQPADAKRSVERDTARLAAAQQAAAKFDAVEVLRAQLAARRSEVWLAHDEAHTALRAGATAFPHAFPHAFPPVTARLSSGDNPEGHSGIMNCLSMSGFH